MNFALNVAYAPGQELNMSIHVFQTLMLIWISIALAIFPIQLRVTAPYGRHSMQSWGAMMPNKLGWVVMEIVSPACLLYFFLSGDQIKTLPMWIFVGIWTLHYLNRSILYPLRTRTSGKKIPVLIVASAIVFNLINGSSNGYYLGKLSGPYPVTWMTDPRFIIGISICILGVAINLWSDEKLLHLRKPGEKGYKIPAGGLFRFISCPNHFGEIMEWAGFAIMCWNLPALAFAVWTAANLIPRALSHHRWYTRQFENYPSNRKAVIPLIL